jgi:hypothetical protein
MVDIPPKDVFFKGKVAAGASKFNPGISTREYGGQINGLGARAPVRDVLGSENRVY